MKDSDSLKMSAYVVAKVVGDAQRADAALRGLRHILDIMGKGNTSEIAQRMVNGVLAMFRGSEGDSCGKTCSVAEFM